MIYKIDLLVASVRYLVIVLSACTYLTSKAEPPNISADRHVCLENPRQSLLTIHGHVTDETGNPIPGAALTVKWTDRETSSDSNGEFRIENVTEKDTIVVSHKSYQPMEFAIEKSRANYFLSLKKAGVKISQESKPIANAELIDISGKIYDEQGKPLPGALLVVKGANQGGLTDKNGTFDFPKVPVNSRIIVSHVSFYSEEFTVEKAITNYQTALKRNTTQLDEIVIVGYAEEPNTSQNPTRGSYSTEKAETAFVIVEQNPEFPGGVAALFKFLGQNMRYPTEASKARIQGRIMITFTVNENGNIRDPQITEGLGYGIDEEALRVILNMPRWIPAKQNGETVSKKFTLPVRFSLE